MYTSLNWLASSGFAIIMSAALAEMAGEGEQLSSRRQEREQQLAEELEGRQESEPAGGRSWVAEALTWKRPFRTLAGFLCANLLFWFLALTPWRLYHLVSLMLLGVVVMQIMKELVLSRVRGGQLWQSLTDRKAAGSGMTMMAILAMTSLLVNRTDCHSENWEVIDSKSDYRLWLNQCIEEAMMSLSVFLQEMSHFKEQNPGKFCLLVCSVCTFFTILGSYIPGVILSYFLLLCAFLCPLFKCNDIGQKVYSNIKSLLPKLDLGISDYVNQKLKERAEMIKTNSTEDDSELDISALCPQISATVVAREMSVSDTDVSEVSWTDNGTFNLSEGNTPQTDTSDDFDRPSDHEEAFTRDIAEFPSVENGAGTNDEDDLSIGIPVHRERKKDQLSTTLDQYAQQDKDRHSAAGLSLPLIDNQAFNLVRAVAGDVVTSVVTAAVRDQLQSMQADPGLVEETDTEEGDDFELLDQSELEQMENELGLPKGQEAKPQEKKSSGFLSNLLGGH